MPYLVLKDINKIYPNGFHAVHDFNLEIEKGEFIVFVGSSGCGKSTTLRMIAGLEDISKGDFLIDGQRANEKGPRDRGVAMVFQSYALYPQMTVYDNLAFGLTLEGIDEDIIEEKVKNVAKILGLTDYLDRLPKALSGGQRQRVALGRAIVRDPQVFLLDEPLSNLDAKLRAQMRTELSKLHKKLGTTFIYVTHDQTEAMTMGDRIVVMKDGYIQQIDSPINLYENPINKFVAGFIGSPQMNFIPAKLLMLNGKYTVEFGSEDTKTSRGRKFYVELPSAKADDEALKYYVDKEVVLGIRPESIHDEEMFLSNAKTGIIEASVDVTEMLGAETFLYLTCEGIPLTARVSPRCTARPQDVVKLALDPNKIHLFDAADEHSLLS